MPMLLLFKQQKGATMNEPNGKDIISFLISLYAEQEGVTIKYEWDGELYQTRKETY